MTSTHKLSRRLALLCGRATPVLVVLSVSCAPADLSDGLGPPDGSASPITNSTQAESLTARAGQLSSAVLGPSSAGVSYSAQGVSTAAGSTTGAPCANQPAGYTRITDEPWSAVPPTVAKNSQGWQVTAGVKQLSTVQDAAAPRSPSGVLQGRFPKGMVGGGGPFHIERAITPISTAPGYSRLYQCFYLKVAPGFTNNGNVGTKLAFVLTPYRATSVQSEFYISLFGNAQDAGYMAIQVSSPTPGFNRAMTTQFRWPQHFGQWHQFEVLAIANTQGKSDGTATFWVDGQRDFSFSNVKWFVDAVPKGTWNFVDISPTYGGGHNPVPYDMYIYIDNWYMSGG